MGSILRWYVRTHGTYVRVRHALGMFFLIVYMQCKYKNNMQYKEREREREREKRGEKVNIDMYIDS